jgi:hypothetical protein
MDSTTALDTLVITPRPLSDYQNMFLLTDDELIAGTILDCPAGASPFGAQVRARGGAVVSVDPTYGLPRDELVARIAGDMSRLDGWVNANLDGADWTYLGSPGALMRAWELAVDFFLTDYRPDGTRYVAASLPSLPFPDNHFRLALSSHLLFSYPEFLSFELHVASLLELARVTSGEVRVFPLVDTACVPYPRLDEVRTALDEHGIATEIRQANCAYNLGGDQMLVLET